MCVLDKGSLVMYICQTRLEELSFPYFFIVVLRSSFNILVCVVTFQGGDAFLQTEVLFPGLSSRASVLSAHLRRRFLPHNYLQLIISQLDSGLYQK